MFKAIVVSCACALSVSTLQAEIVETTDGRKIELRDDGSYVILDLATIDQAEYVEFQKPYFNHHEGEYGQKRVRFMPKFKNVSGKTIVGTKFQARFLNAFGDEIFVFSGETDEKVRNGRTTKSSIFYYFEDNQFLGGQPYDKLLPMVTNSSGEIDVRMTKIAFSDGEIISLN